MACTGASPNWSSTIDRTSVNTCVGNAVDGDTITVGAGDDSTTWTAPVVVNKAIKIQGGGIGVSTIRLAAGFHGPAFRLYKAGGTLTNARVTGFTLSCSSITTDNNGVVQVGTGAGTTACGTSYIVGDFRIDNSRFINCGDMDPVGGLTGNPAICTRGYTYGLIDHNTFDNCNAECIDIGADGTGNIPSNPVSLQRSLAFGHYTSGVVFVEDNTINYNTLGSYGYENFTDGNSGGRATFRYNTFNICPNCNGAALFSNHETCATSSCDAATQGDVGSLVYEIYENTINAPSGTGNWDMFQQRSGRALIYNNHVTYTGSAGVPRGVRLSNYRSSGYAGNCGSAAHARGFAKEAHSVEAPYTSEGLTPNITVLNGAIDATTTTVVLSSTAGLDPNGDANGFAIRIGGETICYSGLSGNTLTGVTRGCGIHTGIQAAAAHANGAAVDYLKFGSCLEQINNTYVWGNSLNGTVTSALNDARICDLTDNQCNGFAQPDYTDLDIKSFTQRPNNWQYKTETSFTYTPYPYPHPLQGGAPPPPPPSNPSPGALKMACLW